MVFCRFCGLHYKNKSSLNRHIKKHEDATTRYHCIYCEKAYVRKDSIAPHINKKQPNQRYGYNEIVTQPNSSQVNSTITMVNVHTDQEVSFSMNDSDTGEVIEDLDLPDLDIGLNLSPTTRHDLIDQYIIESDSESDISPVPFEFEPFEPSSPLPSQEKEPPKITTTLKMATCRVNLTKPCPIRS